jgi:hypothetical protein
MPTEDNAEPPTEEGLVAVMMLPDTNIALSGIKVAMSDIKITLPDKK